ncbi:MAG TPA: RNA polymerase sigma factor region1.1 domain-containing protein, partial [Acidimicrobiia bacterium]
MESAVQGVVERLTERGQQRGFLTVGEIQHELVEAAAPAEAFDSVIDHLQAAGIPIEEEEDEDLYEPVV